MNGPLLNMVFSLALLISLGPLSVYSAEKQDIVVFGASGRIGKVIVDVALERGHNVRGVSRDPSRLQLDHANFSTLKGSLLDPVFLERVVENTDALVVSISARAKDGKPENSLLVKATENIVKVIGASSSRPYIVQMGGANLMYGSSYEEVKRNMHNAAFSYEPGTPMYAVLFGHQISLEMYRKSNLAWSVIAPPMKIMGIYDPPDTTSSRGTYRTSESGPIVAADGSKSIFVRDLAHAVVREIEQRKHVGKLFTVAY